MNSDHNLTLVPARTRVLFVEDNLTQLDLYTMVIQDRFDVLRATRAEEGYRLACTEQPDVIIVDLILPDMDGLMLAEQLRADPEIASIPLVALTGDDAAYERALKKRGVFVAVLAKPCPADRLLHATIERLRHRLAQPHGRIAVHAPGASLSRRDLSDRVGASADARTRALDQVAATSASVRLPALRLEGMARPGARRMNRSFNG